MLNLELSAAIHADRTRDIERRTRDWRLLHPEPVAEPPAVAEATRLDQRRPGSRRAAASRGPAPEAV